MDNKDMLPELAIHLLEHGTDIGELLEILRAFYPIESD